MSSQLGPGGTLVGLLRRWCVRSASVPYPQTTGGERICDLRCFAVLDGVLVVVWTAVLIAYRARGQLGCTSGPVEQTLVLSRFGQVTTCLACQSCRRPHRGLSPLSCTSSAGAARPPPQGRELLRVGVVVADGLLHVLRRHGHVVRPLRKPARRSASQCPQAGSRSRPQQGRELCVCVCVWVLRCSTPHRGR